MSSFNHFIKFLNKFHHKGLETKSDQYGKEWKLTKKKFFHAIQSSKLIAQVGFQWVYWFSIFSKFSPN